MHCDRLTKLPPLSTFLPTRAKARMILSRSAPSLSESFQAVPKCTKEEFVVSIHCGPLTSALVTSKIVIKNIFFEYFVNFMNIR